MSEQTTEIAPLTDAEREALWVIWESGVEDDAELAGLFFFAVASIAAAREAAARAEALSVAASLLERVVDYWDGRPLTHHGDHIHADLVDALRGIKADAEHNMPEHRPNGCCDYHRHIADGCCRCDQNNMPGQGGDPR